MVPARAQPRLAALRRGPLRGLRRGGKARGAHSRHHQPQGQRGVERQLRALRVDRVRRRHGRLLRLAQGRRRLGAEQRHGFHTRAARHLRLRQRRHARRGLRPGRLCHHHLQPALLSPAHGEARIRQGSRLGAGEGADSAAGARTLCTRTETGVQHVRPEGAEAHAEGNLPGRLRTQAVPPAQRCLQ